MKEILNFYLAYYAEPDDSGDKIDIFYAPSEWSKTKVKNKAVKRQIWRFRNKKWHKGIPALSLFKQIPLSQRAKRTSKQLKANA